MEMESRLPRRSALVVATIFGFCGLLLATLLAFALLMLYVGVEGYFPLNPAIDTRFAPGYSEAAWRTIRPGMSKAEVQAALGPPLNNVGDPSWAYSTDGACPWWDFAWLVRTIDFDAQDRVVAVRELIAYD
jgi:hypothetical protein